MRFPNDPPSAAAAPAADSRSVPAAGSGDSLVDYLSYLNVLVHYWWLILPCGVAGAFVGMLFCIYATPIYRATCRLEIFQNQALQVGTDPSVQAFGRSNLGRHIVLFKTQNLNAAVARSVEADWAGRLPLQRRLNLEVAPYRESPGTVLDLKVDSFNPDYSMRYLGELVKAYQQARREEIEAVAASTIDSLQGGQSSLARDLDRAEKALAEFQASHSIKVTQQKQAADEMLLGSLLSRSLSLRTQRAIIDTQLPLLRQADASIVDDVIELTEDEIMPNVAFVPQSLAGGDRARSGGDAGTAATIIPRIQTSLPSRSYGWVEKNMAIRIMKAQYADKLATFKPDHPDMLALQQQIAAAEQELEFMRDIAVKRLMARRDALLMQESSLDRAAEQLRVSLKTDTRDSAEYELLKARIERLRTLQSQIYDRLATSGLNKDTFYSRIIEGPVLAEGSVWPNRPKIMAASLGGSLLLGMGLALLLHLIRVKAFEYSKFEEDFNVRNLGVVPIVEGTHGEPLGIVVGKELHQVSSESFRALRASLESHFVNKGSKVLMVSSPNPGEGKTFCAANLAAVLAWSQGRILLIDGDLRRKSLRHLFPDGPAEGFTDYLAAADGDWRRYVQHTPYAQLDYLPAGTTMREAPELIGSPRASSLFAALRQEYSVIVIDTAPISRIVDSLILMQHADGIVIIAKAGATTAFALRSCLRRLQLASAEAPPVVGYVLNSLDPRKWQHGYHYGSNYGYGQGYSYGYGYGYGYGYRASDQEPRK